MSRWDQMKFSGKNVVRFLSLFCQEAILKEEILKEMRWADRKANN